MTGRIIKGIGGIYYVAVSDRIYECKARGRFRHSKIVPTVGDNVTIALTEEGKGVIDEILPRKNMLVRPRVANIDTAVIVFAIKTPDINTELLDRFLILAKERKIPEVVICINKSDLSSEDEAVMLSKIYSAYSIVFASAKDKVGIDELKSKLKGRVAVFAGPSGVGKSSIINALNPKMERQTGALSEKIKRGKHTTRSVELLELDTDSYIADSPGFTSLSFEHIKREEMQFLFPEFEPYLGDGCYFNDCLHLKEPNCRIKEHVGKEIPQERYDRYVDFMAMLR